MSGAIPSHVRPQGSRLGAVGQHPARWRPFPGPVCPCGACQLVPGRAPVHSPSPAPGVPGDQAAAGPAQALILPWRCACPPRHRSFASTCVEPPVAWRPPLGHPESLRLECDEPCGHQLRTREGRGRADEPGRLELCAARRAAADTLTCPGQGAGAGVGFEASASVFSPSGADTCPPRPPVSTLVLALLTRHPPRPPPVRMATCGTWAACRGPSRCRGSRGGALHASRPVASPRWVQRPHGARAGWAPTSGQRVC